MVVHRLCKIEIVETTVQFYIQNVLTCEACKTKHSSPVRNLVAICRILLFIRGRVWSIVQSLLHNSARNTRNINMDDATILANFVEEIAVTFKGFTYDTLPTTLLSPYSLRSSSCMKTSSPSS